MPSKIKNFDFSGCQHLRKLLIDENVETKGKIDLSETPLKDRNNIYNVDAKFKNIPDGITATPDFLRNKIKLQSASVETQTDPEIKDLNSLNLSADDKKVMELMDDNLFWYNDFQLQGRKGYLEQRRNQLRDILNSDIGANLNDDLKLLAEHILFIGEKILENCKYFDDLGNIINAVNPSNISKKKWSDFHKFLISEVLDQDGIIYRFKPILNISFQIDQTKLGEKQLERFMNSLEATMDKDGSKYYTFPNYDEDWEFEDYYNSDTRFIGIKPLEKNKTSSMPPTLSAGAGKYIFVEKEKFSDQAEEVLKKLFNYWKENK